MNSKKTIIILITLAILLSLFICGIGIYVSKLEKTNMLHKREVFAEKEVIKLELKDLLSNYSEIKVSNTELQEEIDATKNEMDSLYDIINKTTPKLSLLRVYRFQISKLKKEKVRLLKVNDSLLTVTILMKDSLNLKDSQIEEYFKVRKILYDENLALTAEIKKKKQLSFYGTNGTGVKIKKSGKVSLTDKIKKLNKLKICTTVKSDSQLISESKRVYFKVFNPKKILLGKSISARHEGESILYSAIHKFFYNNQRLEICKFLEVDSIELVPGEYTVEVYLNHKLQDITQFQLR